MFKFDYVPAEQLRSNVTLVPGRAQFVITGWTDKNKEGIQMFTQSGDPRVDLILTVSDCTGQEGKYFDILTPKTNWKLKSILDAIGMPELYTASGELNLDQLVFKGGVCDLKPPKGDFKRLDIQYLTAEQAKKPYIQPAPSMQGFEPMGQQYKPKVPPATIQQMEEYDNEIPF
jgi:hypothetical protein